MRRHAKAASAASTLRRDNGAGDTVRGVPANRAASHRANGRRASIVFALLACSVLFLVAISPASAAVVTQRPLLFAIDGASVPAGPLQEAGKVAVDNATGAVYVSERGAFKAGVGVGRIYRFHADGTPWPFSSTGLPYLEGTSSNLELYQAGLAVDNSGGANQSRLYVADFGASKLHAFAPTGELLWTIHQPGQPGDVAVDPAGHPYTISKFGGPDAAVRKYANTGSPPALLSSFPAVGSAIDANAAEDLFLGSGSTVDKWVSGAFSSVFDPAAQDVYVDQSAPTGPVFTVYGGRTEFQKLFIDATAGQFRLSFEGAQTPDLPFNASEVELREAFEALPTVGAHNGVIQNDNGQPGKFVFSFRGLLTETNLPQVVCENGTVPLSGGTGCAITTTSEGVSSDFQEYDSGGTLLNTAPSDTVNAARSIAYNPSLDRVYVLQQIEEGAPSVLAFGESATGTVADLAIDAPNAIGIATAHFSGNVNPQGTSSQWRFQWRKAGQGWATAPASPLQALPADSSDHVVEFTTDGLRGGTTYQVRLVAVNSANQLAGTSEIKTFTTSAATQAPAVTIAAPSAITTNGATIKGTVNPQSDTADWRVQLTTDPSCAGGYANQPLQLLSPSSAVPVNVEYGVAGLLPAQHYCARIAAVNSAGSTTSGFVEFETGDVLPTQVFTAYAAPRTDTSTRVNGYVNPEGSDATYHFEYSSDGSSWTVLPDAQTQKVRRQITVASELSGLQPSTTYHYRFVVENGAGPVQSDEGTFETRSSAEMEPAARGIELVNQPNKGNQNPSLQRPLGYPSMVSADGERAFWSVTAGAPGGNSGTSVPLLSVRTPSGWQTRAVLPPAAQQVGLGEYAYKLSTMTPDFDHFVFRAAESSAETIGPNVETPTVVRIDDEQHQDALATIGGGGAGGAAQAAERADVTADGSHVLVVNPQTKQLEDVGDTPEVVSIMPDGLPSECGVVPEAFSGSSSSGSGWVWKYGYHRMATTDASRVYFKAKPNGQCGVGGDGAIFYRDRIAQQTTEVDDLKVGTVLVRSTPDGGSLYFITPKSHAADDLNSTADLYRWDSETGDYTCVTCIVPEAQLSRDQNYAPVAISDDFSHFYFASPLLLVPGHGELGASNIYALGDEGLKFVVTERPKAGGGSALQGMQLSSDGEVLVFRNQGGYEQLTADPLSSGSCLDPEGNVGPCDELYRYEYADGSLECVSCNHAAVTKYALGSSGTADYFQLSRDGRTIAFVTRQQLLAEDINNGYDVYQWHNGATGLISDGETQYPNQGNTTAPKAYGIDATGDSIFFSLVDPGLTGYEQDRLANLYVSRVGGGFPRPSEPAHCSEESCQGPLVAPPPEQRSGSGALDGAGNESTSTKKKGRCAGKRGKAKSRCLQAKKRKKHKKQSAKRANSQRGDRGAK